MLKQWLIIGAVLTIVTGCATLSTKKFDVFEINAASATYEEVSKMSLINSSALYIPEALQVQPLSAYSNKTYFTNCRLLLDPGKHELFIRMIRDDYKRDSLQITTKVKLRKRFEPRTAYVVTGERQDKTMVFKLKPLTPKEQRAFEFALIEKRRTGYHPKIKFSDAIDDYTVIDVTGSKMDFKRVHLSSSTKFLVFEKSGRTDSGLSVHLQRAIIVRSLESKVNSRVLAVGVKDYMLHAQADQIWLASLSELYLWNNKINKKMLSFKFDSKDSTIKNIKQIVGVLSEQEVLVELKTDVGTAFYKVNFKTQQAKPITSGSLAALSRDKQKLFYSNDRNFFIYNLMTGEKTQLLIKTKSRHLTTEPAWSPDGMFVAFTATERAWDVQRNANLYVVRVKDGHVIQLTNDGNAAYPCWGAKDELFFVDSQHEKPEAILAIIPDLPRNGF